MPLSPEKLGFTGSFPDLVDGLSQSISDKYSALRQADEDLLLSDIFGPDLPPVQSAVEEFSLASGLSPPTLAPVNGDGSSTALPHGFMPSDLLDSADLSSLTLNGKL